MIKAIRAENIYNFIQPISAITNLATIFSMKPDENSTPDGSYVFVSIVSDIPKTQSQIGYLMKTARVSFHIVCKKKLKAQDTPERVLMTIVDTINNNIVFQWCWNQKTKVDWLIMNSILEDTASPIFFSENRHYLVKDYLFNYISVV